MSAIAAVLLAASSMDPEQTRSILAHIDAKDPA